MRAAPLLDPTNEYLDFDNLNEFDEADLSALRHRLLHLRDMMADASFQKTVNGIIANNIDELSEIYPSSIYIRSNPNSGLREEIHVTFPQNSSAAYQFLKVQVAARPGQRSIMITEDIMHDGWNRPQLGDQKDLMLCIIDRWIHLTQRPLFPYQNRIEPSPYQQVTEANHLIQDVVTMLVHKSGNQALIALPSKYQFVHGGRYQLPNVYVNFAIAHRELHSLPDHGPFIVKLLTPEGQSILAKLLPSIVGLQHQSTEECVSYRFTAMPSNVFDFFLKPVSNHRDVLDLVNEFPINAIEQIDKIGILHILASQQPN